MLEQQGEESEDTETDDENAEDETKTDTEKNQKNTREYNDYYKSCLNVAKRMSQLHTYNKALKVYVPTYSAQELLEWIQSFDLSSEEKSKICSQIGIRYMED